MKKIFQILLICIGLASCFFCMQILRKDQCSMLELEAIIDVIAPCIHYYGFKRTIVNFVLGSYQEEMIYRGPLLLLFFLFPSQQNKRWLRFIAWCLLIFLTFQWTVKIHSTYPLFYQSVIFFGGLVNGSCIIYLKNKVLGMLLAVFLHSAVNISVIYIVYYYFL